MNISFSFLKCTFVFYKLIFFLIYFGLTCFDNWDCLWRFGIPSTKTFLLNSEYCTLHCIYTAEKQRLQNVRKAIKLSGKATTNNYIVHRLQLTVLQILTCQFECWACTQSKQIRWKDEQSYSSFHILKVWSRIISLHKKAIAFYVYCYIIYYSRFYLKTKTLMHFGQHHFCFLLL